VPGDILELRAGDTFPLSTTLTLPAFANAGADWIYIRSMNWANLGTIDRRATASDTADMPKIEFQNTITKIDTEWNAGGNKANRWRLMGLEITATHNVTTSTQQGLVRLGRYGTDFPTAAADEPFHLIIDRCYIHGQSAGNYAFGVEVGTKQTAIISSSIQEIHIDGDESQGITVPSGTGDLQVDNCLVECAGINMLIGGSRQRIDQAQFDNVTVRRNYFTKPVAWKASSWTVKNVFETKFSRYGLVEGNRFTNSWAGGQDGP